ncbi:MAG: right-handed parallel beta-helix repeat-containing protein [Bacteroidales bacterium]
MILYGGRSNKGLVTFTDAGGEIHDILLSSSDHNGIRCEGASTPLCQTNVEIKNCNSDPIAMSLKANPTFSFSGMTMKSNGNGSNGIRIIEGTLSSDASLVPRDVGGIYNIAYIVDKLTIAAGAKLTIHQGVVIKFIGHTSLIKVEGALIADGISEDKIVFTSLKDDSRGGDTNDDGNNSVPLKGDWWSISFHGSAMDHESILDNCVLNYGGANRPGYGDLKDFGTIRIIDAAITIDSCMIEQSSTSAFGIYGSASPSFTKCGIHNIRYTPVTMSMFASPFFSGNVVSNLGIAAIGIAKETYALDGTIPVRNFAGYNNITYFMYRTCKVNSGTILTIPAGVVFKSGAYDCFEVEGTINIEGTKASPVVFTHEHDDMHGNPRDTNEDGDDSSPTVMSNYGLNFADISNDTSTISNAVFRYKNAGINLHQASPKIKECTFNACDFGIILRGVSHPEVDSCTFDDLTLTPLLMSLVSYPASTQANQITGHTYKALGVLSEVLVQDITLEKRNFAGIDNISYFFHGDYTIGTSVVLTVSPGLVLKFNKNAELLVQRGLIAEGGSTADSNIVFTDYRDDFYGGDINADGNESEPDFWNWGGIRFDKQALDNLCRLKYFIIRYAGRYSNEAAITTQVASPSITNCVIAYNRNGVRAEGASNPLINYCDIYENEDYGVNNVNKAFVINARHNWWGSATGPTHSTNPGGLGELVSDAVDFGDFGGLTNPVMGDVSLNGKVQAYDASLVLKEVIHMMMFLPQQAEVADVSHDGSITAYDASLILQYVAGSILTFPAELKSTSIETLNDAKIRFEVLGPDENNQFQLIVSGESIDRFSSLEIPLIMDLSQLSLSAIETTTLSKEMMLMHHMDHESSTLRIALAGQENFRDDGELLRIILSANRNSSELVITPGTVLLNEEPSRIYPGRINVHGGALPVFADPVDKLPLDISPLPMVDYLSISFTVPESNNKILISMHDLQGRTIQIIREGNPKPGNYKVFLDKSDLRPSVVRGTYLVRYHDGKNVHVKKIVIH